MNCTFRKILTAYVAKTTIALAMMPTVVHAQNDAEEPGTYVVSQLYKEDNLVVRELGFNHPAGRRACVMRRGVIGKRFQIETHNDVDGIMIFVQDATIDWASGVYQIAIDGERVMDAKMLNNVPHGVTLSDNVSADQSDDAGDRFADALLSGHEMTFDFAGDAQHKPIHYTVSMTGFADALTALFQCDQEIRPSIDHTHN